MKLGWRLVLLALLLAVEGLLIFAHVRDAERSAIARWGAACGAIFIALGYPRARRAIERCADEANEEPLAWRFLGGHAAAIVLLLAVTQESPVGLASWCAVGAIGVACAAVAFVPPRVCARLLRATGNTWIYAAGGAFAAAGIAPYLWLVWDRFLLQPASAMTFGAVKFLIEPLVSGMVANPRTFVIGSGKFQVTLAGPCSGWEGAGLAFVFTAVWLWVSRRECRFPQALLLIPFAMGAMFALNIFRIAALIVIGDAGWARIAMSGFHSQAGWIAFNSVAVGIAWAAPRVGWISVSARLAKAGSNATVCYLLPFAAILAAGMVSRAVADGFEWLYPLRFFAACGALWFCRREYEWRTWRPGWFPVVAGAVMFVIWVACDRGPRGDGGIGVGLAAMSGPARAAWTSFRTLAAVVTVPIAEELAFRGFLLRRFVAREFEAIDLRRLPVAAVIGSSLVFGALHGDRWLAGTLAGAVYAGAMWRKGKLGDAVLAHAVTNALLGGWVLFGSRWWLW